MNKIIIMLVCVFCIYPAHSEIQLDQDFINELHGFTTELAISEGISAGYFSEPAEMGEESDFDISIVRLPIPVYSMKLGAGVFRTGIKLGYLRVKKEYYQGGLMHDGAMFDVKNSSVAVVAGYQYPFLEDFFVDSEFSIARSKMTVDITSDNQAYRGYMSSYAWAVNPSVGVYYKYTKGEINSLMGLGFRSMQTIDINKGIAPLENLRSDIVSIKMDLDKKTGFYVFDTTIYPLGFLYLSKYIKGNSISHYLAELGTGFYVPLGVIAGQPRVLKLSTSIIRGEEGFRGWTLGAALVL
ncbi:hypothetical protein [Janthinobacterium sp. B9-8]|uniref:hypothetical protein n=1 Tax=Janthinobacterium sp. B9-8 TaxID=1236179 RepID=UPI00061D158F|nr:hypothetical protein [Janthinobacterium sp. B9-8]AMC34473.1 hypothetical protein VN23_07585 [Janthinobacterium sp. B9-8]